MLGALWFAVRFAVRLLSLRRIHRQSRADTWRWFRYRRVFVPVQPFSFWRNIYVNIERHPDDELAGIFRHEQVHVSGLHTVDVLVAELCSVLCWFNPGMWLLRYAIRENLEFITDRNVLKSGVDKKAYQYSLVDVGRRTASYPAIANGFNFNNLKRRIMMMNKEKSSQLQLGRYLLVVPAIAVLALVFTVSRAAPDVPDSVEPGHGNKRGNRMVMSDTTETQQQPMIRISGTMPAGDDAPLLILDGKELDETFKLNSIDPHTIDNITVLKDASATERYGERGKNGVVIITSKGRAGGGTSDSVEAARQEAARPQDTGRNKGVVVIGYREEASGRDSTGGAGFADALIVINGKEATAAELKKLSPEDIAAVNVLKGADAKAKYGDKGKKGVVEVTLATPAAN